MIIMINIFVRIVRTWTHLFITLEWMFGFVRRRSEKEALMGSSASRKLQGDMRDEKAVTIINQYLNKAKSGGIHINVVL